MGLWDRRRASRGIRCHFPFFPFVCFFRSSLLRGICTLGAAVLDLIGRYEYFGGHAGNIRALGIVEADLQDDRLDVALPPADIALSGVVSFNAFEENLAARD